MIPLRLDHLARAAGAVLMDAHGRPAGPDAPEGRVLVDGPVVTDSRECRPGSLYVARVGEHADGHAYIGAAQEAGAVAALTSRPVGGVAHLLTDDVQTAFGAIARAVVDAAPDLTIVGITGSSGKTSTKDLLAQVLRTGAETVAPEGSYNGEIGVPLTVCRITPTTRFLVAEMGSRGIGHIAYLTRIAPPRIGIVLNVGQAHVGEFGGRDNIARAKAELVAALPSSGVAILNADDPAVCAMATATTARVVLVGESAAADIRAQDVELDESGRPTFRVLSPAGTAQVRLRLHGRHHVGNALSVIAAALECGLPLDDIVAALAVAGPVSRWRMEVTERADGVTIVNDAYNANPDSMGAALRALRAMKGPADAGPGRRTWAVLGEMFELGPDSHTEHQQVGAVAVAQDVDRLVVVGAGAGLIGDGAVAAGMPPAHLARVPDTDAAYALLTENLRRGDVVLFKSSRDAGLRWLGDRVAETVHGNEVRS